MIDSRLLTYGFPISVTTVLDEFYTAKEKYIKDPTDDNWGSVVFSYEYVHNTLKQQAVIGRINWETFYFLLDVVKEGLDND